MSTVGCNCVLVVIIKLSFLYTIPNAYVTKSKKWFWVPMKCSWLVAVHASVFTSLPPLLRLLSSLWWNASTCTPIEWLTVNRNWSRLYAPHLMEKDTLWCIYLVIIFDFFASCRIFRLLGMSAMSSFWLPHFLSLLSAAMFSTPTFSVAPQKHPSLQAGDYKAQIISPRIVTFNSSTEYVRSKISAE